MDDYIGDDDDMDIEMRDFEQQRRFGVDIDNDNHDDDDDDEIDPYDSNGGGRVDNDGLRIPGTTSIAITGSRLISCRSVVFIVLVVVVVVTLSAMYVDHPVGLFMSSEEQVDALVETFDSESGTVSNNLNNKNHVDGGESSNNKFKTALDKKNNNNNGGSGSSGSSYWSKRHKNPFANPVTTIDGGSTNDHNSINRNKVNNKGPRGSSKNGGGVLGGGGGGGGRQHPKIGGGIGGGSGSGGGGGGDGKNGDGSEMLDLIHKKIQSDPPSATTATPPPPPPPTTTTMAPTTSPTTTTTSATMAPTAIPTTTVGTTINDTQHPNGGGGGVVVVDEAELYCEDLTKYQDWYDANVTLGDGIMYKIHEKLDHDAKAFTQGLTYARGKLFESTGLYGQSTVRVLDKDSANVTKKVGMEPRLFGEGMTFYKDKLVQITWKSQEGFIYSMDDLHTIDRFRYTTTLNEGWGITWDRCNDELIVTDGSPNLHFWDPETMAEKRKIPVVRLNGTPAKRLNEIEFWRGRVLANVWFEDVLLVINPTTGLVEKEYDFKSLWPEAERKTEGADVFNGISVSAIPEQLYVTGKLWNRMFVVELLP